MRNYFATFKRVFPGAHYVLASLMLILGVFTIIYALGVSQGLFLRTWITSLDQQVLSTVLAHRDASRSGFFLFFTYLGNWEIIASISVVLLIILFLTRKIRAIWFFIITLAVGQASSFLFKYLLARNRPDSANALIEQAGYSFPSGHALGAFTFYGVLTYFIYTLARNSFERALTTASGLTLIGLIGVSRIYLGVHWLSDVIAGWIMGATLLIVCIVFFEHRKALFPVVDRPPLLSTQVLWLIGILLSCAEAAFIILFYLTHPLR